MSWLTVSITISCAIVVFMLFAMRRGRKPRRATWLWGLVLLVAMALVWVRVGVNNRHAIPGLHAVSQTLHRGVDTVKYQLGLAETATSETTIIREDRAAGTVTTVHVGPGEPASHHLPEVPWIPDALTSLPGGRSVVWHLLSGLAIFGFLYLGYLFIDAGTRGQFTWQLRFISILAFVGICVALLALRGSL